MSSRRKKPDITRLMQLQRLLLSFSQIDRVVHRQHTRGHYRRENDTEHSYNLVMTAWFLAPHFPDLHRDLLIRYALVHDLVEVHAGDTYIYGAADHLATKHAREQEAARTLAADWPDFAEIHELIKAYENRSTPEARFIYALDKIMPVMQIYINNGYSWRKHNVTVDMLYNNKIGKVALSPEIVPYFEQLYKLLLDSPDLIRPR